MATSIPVRLRAAEHFKLTKKPLSQVPSAEALGGVFVIEEEMAGAEPPSCARAERAVIQKERRCM